MRHHARPGHALASAIATACVIVGTQALTQVLAPTNAAPNPYRSIENWSQLPDGRMWGSTAAVDIRSH